MCFQQAAKMDADESSSWAHHISHQYTSHYDPKANICYVMFVNAMGDEKGKAESLWFRKLVLSPC
jgi:hypothetical protein